MSQSDTRQAVWSRYWSHGAAHSCGGSYGNRYEGALAQFWRAAFGGLKDGARVLDICTGNGPLPQLLLDMHKGSSISCDAIDLAVLAPEWYGKLPEAQRAQVRFHGQQAAEQLPFSDHSFDMVVSQYGLEYTDLAGSVPELLRVLAKDGKVRLIAHHVDARPVRLAVTELAHLGWLQQPQGLLEVAAAMIEPMARAGTAEGRASLAGDQRANALRDQFNDLQSGLSALADASDCPDVLIETRHAIAAVFEGAMREGRAHGEQLLADLRQQQSDSALRLQELCDYALDDKAAGQLCKTLTGDDGKVVLDPVSDQGVLMGWCISVDRG
jgi:SAM-dependent methyltransferase